MKRFGFYFGLLALAGALTLLFIFGFSFAYSALTGLGVFMVYLLLGGVPLFLKDPQAKELFTVFVYGSFYFISSLSYTWSCSCENVFGRYCFFYSKKSHYKKIA